MRTPILCYHKVGPEAEEGRRLNVNPTRFRTHAAFFARRGYRFLRAHELAEPWQDRQICFTFDDAYVSAVHYAAEALESFQARGTFYAVSERAGKASDWDGDKARPLADFASLRKLEGRGHEIGNHTATHPHLDQLPETDQLQELRQAHLRLRQAGLTPRSFCYPYGGLTEATPKLVRSLGYAVGLALRKGLATPADDPLTLPRIVVAYSDALPMLLYKLTLRPWLRRLKI